MKSQRFKITFLAVAIGVVFMVGSTVIFWRNFISSAETAKFALKGKVKSETSASYGSSKPIAGAQVTFYASSGGQRTVTTTSDGSFTIYLEKPLSCVYKYVVSSPEYNVYRNWWNPPVGSNTGYLTDITLSREVDVTSSLCCGIVGNGSRSSPGAKLGGYRVSNVSDWAFFRNLSKPDQFGSAFVSQVAAPTKAKIKLKVKSNWYSKTGYQVRLVARALPGEWRYNLLPTGLGVAGSTDINLDHDLAGELIELDADISSLSAEYRFYTYINGFSVGLQDLMATDKRVQGVNIEFTRSEDGEPTTIEYSGDEKYADISLIAQNYLLRNCIINEAQKYKKATYIYGAQGGFDASGKPLPVDCSSLVNNAYRVAGLWTGPVGETEHGNTTFTQYDYFNHINKSALKPGDLVFRKPESSNYGHVGIYLGGGNVIQAKGEAFGVVVTKLDGQPGENPWLAFGRHPYFAISAEERQ